MSEEVGVYDVLESGCRATPMGPALLVRIHRVDGAAMPWRELWGVFEQRYPGRWAVQMLPPRDLMMDQANKYHLFVLPKDFAPMGLDIGRDPSGKESR